MEQCIEQYPVELYPIAEVKPKKFPKFDYHKKYSIKSLILLFFSFAFIGWCWEVGLFYFTEGTFINRGFLLGPWLPIYGSGGVLMILLLRKWIDKPVLTFFLIMILCATVEYFTSYFMESFYNIKWWDYSGYLLNLNGRICLEGTVFFGVGGCAIIYIVAPLFDDLYHKINPKIEIALCLILVSLFVADFCHSISKPNTGDGITSAVPCITEKIRS
ncbi:MAG: putative ABC transporter permease [Clostridiales bacterium]